MGNAESPAPRRWRAWTTGELRLLRKLSIEEGLPLRELPPHFPGRTYGSLGEARLRFGIVQEIREIRAAKKLAAKLAKMQPISIPRRKPPSAHRRKWYPKKPTIGVIP